MKVETNNRIRIAVQKSGRLSDDTMLLLKKCGIKVRKSKTRLFYHSENFPLDILLVRDDDIPELVMDRICDYGVVGTNVLQEKSLSLKMHECHSQVVTVYPLHFGACRLSIAVPEDYDYTHVASLTGKRIATTYPQLLTQFLASHQVTAHVCVLTGSVEIAPGLDIADAICDLVSTGSTLEANGLKEVDVVFQSKAVLVKSEQVFVPQKQLIAELFERRVEGVLQANENKYILLHVPKSALAEVIRLLPGTGHPTVIPLAEQADTVAVHSVCRETVFWETMEQLKAVGAHSILVLPIEKMML
jgi:ATP phosphoribosyltransferase